MADEGINFVNNAHGKLFSSSLPSSTNTRTDSPISRSRCHSRHQ
jgi:hypothetical protein